MQTGATLTQMRHSLRNLLAVTLAIVLGVGFVAAVLQVGGVIERSAWNSVAAQYNGADAIITDVGGGSIPASTIETIRAVDGVETVEGRALTSGDLSAGSRVAYTLIAALPEAQSLRDGLALAAGRLAQASGEIVVIQDALDLLQLDLGSTATLKVYTDDAGLETPVQVVGILRRTSHVSTVPAPDLYGWPADVRTWSGPSDPTSILVTASDGSDPAEMRAAINSALDFAYNVRSRDQQAAAMMDQITDGTDLLTIGLLGFAAIALFVAGLVITNTFTILVAQRTRHLALLRCIGATRSQLQRSVIAESTLLGVLASLAGIGVGIAVIQIGVRALDRFYPSWGVATDPPVRPWALLVPLILGVLVTAGAAIGPARRATRVSPLAALRPAMPDQFRSRVTVVRGLTALALLGIGGSIMLGGMALAQASPGMMPVLISMLGGILSFFGVLVAAIVIVPRLVAAMGGAISTIGGAPAQIATSNSLRNPRRTTATAAALLIAVTLVTMMSVGAESAKSTLSGEIDDRSPVDLVIGGSSTVSADGETTTYQALPNAVPTALDANPDIATWLPVLITEGRIADFPIQIQGLDYARAVEITRVPAHLDGLQDGTAILSSFVANNAGINDGDSLPVVFGAKRLKVTVRVANLPDIALILTEADARRLDSAAPVAQYWAKLDDDADAGETIASLQDALIGVPDLWYGGGAQERASDTDVLDTMLLIVSGLLGVAVVISVVGVSNTLSLSVLERTRESAVLRAIGLTRRQLRIMLAIEGVLIALVGAVIGLALGIAYGFAGTLALIGGTWNVRFALPWDRLALIAAIAFAAGLIASVLPARQALKTSPVAALAE